MRTVLVMLATALLVSACGAKGPLYLPTPTGTVPGERQAVPPTSSPAGTLPSVPVY